MAPARFVRRWVICVGFGSELLPINFVPFLLLFACFAYSLILAP